MNLYCCFVKGHTVYYILPSWNYEKESKPRAAILFTILLSGGSLTMTILIKTLSAFEASLFHYIVVSRKILIFHYHTENRANTN